jgi:23S rRNA pseudouridine1911/1915/1917 synthase
MSLKSSFPTLQPLDVKAENIPLEIIYEDDDLLFVNKPKGMVVHLQTATMRERLLMRCSIIAAIAFRE